MSIESGGPCGRGVGCEGGVDGRGESRTSPALSLSPSPWESRRIRGRDLAMKKKKGLFFTIKIKAKGGRPGPAPFSTSSPRGIDLGEPPSVAKQTHNYHPLYRTF